MAAAEFAACTMPGLTPAVRSAVTASMNRFTWIWKSNVSAESAVAKCVNVPTRSSARWKLTCPMNSTTSSWRTPMRFIPVFTARWYGARTPYASAASAYWMANSEV